MNNNSYDDVSSDYRIVMCGGKGGKMVSYDDARRAIEVLYMTGHPEISNGWHDMLDARNKMSPAVAYLFPSLGSQYTYTWRKESASYASAAEHLREALHFYIERTALELVLSVLDQIDPATAPGDLWVSESLRDKIKEE